MTESESLYKERKPRSPRATNFPPPEPPSWRGGPAPLQHHPQGRRGAKEPLPLGPPPPQGPPPPPPWLPPAVSSSRGCTSPSTPSSTSSSSCPCVSSLLRGRGLVRVAMWSILSPMM